jgi:serine/threonine protein kinase
MTDKLQGEEHSGDTAVPASNQPPVAPDDDTVFAASAAQLPNADATVLAAAAKTSEIEAAYLPENDPAMLIQTANSAAVAPAGNDSTVLAAPTKPATDLQAPLEATVFAPAAAPTEATVFVVTGKAASVPTPNPDATVLVATEKAADSPTPNPDATVLVTTEKAADSPTPNPNATVLVTTEKAADSPTPNPGATVLVATENVADSATLDPDATAFIATETAASPEPLDPDATAFIATDTAASSEPRDPDATELIADITSDAAITGQDASDEDRVIGIGSVINNRFEVVGTLGEGGMGSVFRALDRRKEEAQDREPHVAIKVLGGDFKQHPQAFIALQREARKSQTLAHPNIITVYDFDRDGDIFYMTMEQLNGMTLEDFIKAHPKGAPIKQATDVIIAIAKALAYAHSKNIVHSDLKPGNVFVSADGNVKILDFGIARAVATISDDQGDKTLFDAGELGGLTPTYASREMFLGEEPHPGDDLYALGIMAYEILGGSHPYLRKPANIAVAEKMKITRLKGLKNKQWQAVAGALALHRDDRLNSAELFIKKYEGIAKTTKVLLSTLVAVSLILGSIAIFRPPATGPDIAFEQLAPPLQQKITQSLSKGEQAIGFGDINGALFHFNNAYELHPKNPDAEEGLDTVLRQIVSNVDLQADVDALKQYSGQVDTLLKYSALTDNAELLDLKKALDKAQLR